MMLYRWEGLEEQVTFYALMKPQRLLIKEVGLCERVIWNLGTSVSILFSWDDSYLLNQLSPNDQIEGANEPLGLSRF